MDNLTAGDYEKSFHQYGESPKALHWSNYKVPAVRYRELVHDLEIEGRSILDAGCGMGDLLPFLYAKNPNFSYLGVDIKPEFIEIAKKRYEGHKFMVGDAFSDDIGRFDIVITSGTLNGNIENWMEKRKDAIGILFNKANLALAFTMSGGIKPVKNTPITAYANLREILTFCSSMTPKIILRSHYSSRGFTIIMLK